ncbi:MAG: type II secretion system F family protein [Phycisphaeraceae bacterium]|nr:type II secretion system F family protein [Phycisphaeraceae bacterium]MCW5754831.1 type II secretion system F family protein [Phycisphaeraceae bacterium]
MKYKYRAFDARGTASVGTIEAADEREASDRLREKGLFVSELHVAEVAKAAAAASRGLHPGKGRLKNLAIFTRQLSVLVGAGTPVIDALSALEKQAPEGAWRKVIADVRRRVEEGESFAEAASAHPRAFDAVAQSLIAAGEASGAMDVMLKRLAALARRRQHVRSSVIGALVYPVLLITVSLCVIIVLLTSVLPRFSEMFDSLDAPLPASTEVLMTLGEWLRAHWYVPLGFAAGGVALGVAVVRTPSGRRKLDAVLLHVPLIGPIARSFSTAQIARMLGTLLESKVPLLEALALTRQAAGNSLYRDLLEHTEDRVTQGDAVSRTLATSSLITPSVCEAIRSGEASGNIGPVLTHVAEFIDEDNDVVIRSLSSLVEPVILIGLGAVVAVVAISMFLPMFDLAASAPGAH